MDQLAAGLVNVIKFVVVSTALNLVALWARGGGVGLLGNNRTLSVLVLFGLVGLLSALLFAISVPSMFAGFASQLGQFKRTVEGDPMLEFRYPGTAADHNQEPIRCLIPLKELADGAFVAHGVAQFWHVNGQPAAEVPFHEGQADGSFTLWHSNGQKKSEGYWSGGRKADRWQYWNSDGLPIATVEYEFDVLLDGRSPHDSACDLRSSTGLRRCCSTPICLQSACAKHSPRIRQPLAGWWSECSASATG